jgi:hypothetical protein
VEDCKPVKKPSTAAFGDPCPAATPEPPPLDEHPATTVNAPIATTSANFFIIPPAKGPSPVGVSTTPDFTNGSPTVSSGIPVPFGLFEEDCDLFTACRQVPCVVLTSQDSTMTVFVNRQTMFVAA